jgi:hypothetical protein
MDHALDIVVEPDGAWHWRDEDDFAETQRLGVFTTEEAAAVRAEGERVVAARPWLPGATGGCATALSASRQALTAPGWPRAQASIQKAR